MTFLEQAHSAARGGNLDEVLRLTIAHFRADTGTIHLLEADGVMHLKAASTGIPEPVLKAVQVVPIGKGMAGLAVERKDRTSELQSHSDLVCRLRLEKKNFLDCPGTGPYDRRSAWRPRVWQQGLSRP